MADPRLVVTRLIWTAITLEAGIRRFESTYVTCYILWYIACYITHDVQPLPGGIHKQQNSDSCARLAILNKAPVADPSDELIEVHLAALNCWSF